MIGAAPLVPIAPAGTLAFGFAQPALFAAGAACVAIPILIHLLMRRRRRPQRWAAMRFLMEAYRKQRRRLKLEQFPLLAARCLVVLLVALALGRPVLSAAGLLGGGATTLYLLIDNSLTAAARDADGATALERHAREAQRLLDELDPDSGDRAALIAIAGPAEPVILPPSSDLGAVAQFVQRLTPEDSRADLAGAVQAARSTLRQDARPNERFLVAVLSDFLAGSAPIEERLAPARGGLGEPVADGGPRVELLATEPAEAGPENVTVAEIRPLRSVVISTPGAEAGEATGSLGQVRVRLQRSGANIGRERNVRARLFVRRPGGERTPAGEGAARFQPGQTEAVVSIATEPAGLPPVGAAVLSVELDADALPNDNTRRRAVALRESIRVGLIATPRLAGGPGVASFAAADWLRLALQPTDDLGRSALEVIAIDPAGVDATRLAGLDAAVVSAPGRVTNAGWQRLADFARAGGMVIVHPSGEEGVQLWTEPFARAMALPWTIAREPTADAGAALDGAAPEALAPSDLEDPLALIRAELAELAPPVSVARRLDIDTNDAGVPVLPTNQGDPFLLIARPGATGDAETDGRDRRGGDDPRRGLVALLTAAPDLAWTNLPAKPLMIPMVQELVRQGVGKARGGSVTPAGTAPPAPAGAVELRQGDARTVRVDGGRAETAIRTAGVWEAIDDRGRVREVLVVNPDARAGNTDAVARDDLARWLATADLGAGPVEVRWIEPRSEDSAGAEAQAAAIGADPSDRSMAWPLLLAAGVVALIEMLLARFASHATIPSPAGGRGA